MTRKEESRRSEGVTASHRYATALFCALLVTASTSAAVSPARPASHGRTVSHGMSRPALVSEANSNEATAGVTNSQEGGGQQTETDKVVIALGGGGFAPAQVTRASGDFALAVETQDATGEYVVHLKDAGGTVLNEVRVRNGSAAWPVDLRAGTYTLTVANHPEWVCQIIVQ